MHVHLCINICLYGKVLACKFQRIYKQETKTSPTDSSREKPWEEKTAQKMILTKCGSDNLASGGFSMLRGKTSWQWSESLGLRTDVGTDTDRIVFTLKRILQKKKKVRRCENQRQFWLKTVWIKMNKEESVLHHLPSCWAVTIIFAKRRFCFWEPSSSPALRTPDKMWVSLFKSPSLLCIVFTLRFVKRKLITH